LIAVGYGTLTQWLSVAFHAGPPVGESLDGDKFKIFIAKIYLT
jgi:hypothetical protein